MQSSTTSSRAQLIATPALILGFAFVSSSALAQDGRRPSYENMPELPPPIVRSLRYDAIPEGARGPAIDPAKGYRVEDFGSGAFMVTEGVHQVMVVKHSGGVVLADAPPAIGAKLFEAVEEISPGAEITHLIYSHAHIDHIGFAGEILGRHSNLAIVAHEEAAKLLRRAVDPARPMPTKTFGGTNETFVIDAGGQRLELTYPGPNHDPGNIEIFHPASKTLMLVDVIFPAWMPWRRLALTEDVPGYFEVVQKLNGKYDFEHLVAGHLNRAGTKHDVEVQLAFMRDLHAAAAKGLRATKPGETVDQADLANPWAVYDNYIDRVVVSCVSDLAPKWRNRLAGFDVFIYDQCMTMEQSLRIDGPSLR
jgi:glyoxylase-like metal-dependent hydrolase (beta-lactamase superfamily II)